MRKIMIMMLLALTLLANDKHKIPKSEKLNENVYVLIVVYENKQEALKQKAKFEKKGNNVFISEIDASEINERLTLFRCD